MPLQIEVKYLEEVKSIDIIEKSIFIPDKQFDIYSIHFSNEFPGDIGDEIDSIVCGDMVEL
jgi:hypothetical protein